MSGTQGMEFISMKARACSEAFDRSNRNWRLPSLFTTGLEDQSGRFNVWASSVGVFAKPRASLDFRLREAPEIRAKITGMLAIILQSIQSVEQLSNPHATHSRSTDYISALDQNAGTDIARTIKEISDDIGLLHRLTDVIRQTTAERVYREAAAEPRLINQLSQEFKAHAHRFVTEKFPRCSNFLCERLSLAMLIRRNRFRYLQERYKDLEPERYPDTTYLEPHIRRYPLGTISPDSATAFQPVGAMDHNDGGMDRSCRFVSVDGDSETSSSGIKFSTYNGVSYPPPPQASDSTEATCPYCLITLPAAEFHPTREWIEHLKADLDPYMCLYERCELPPERLLFEERRDWINHMRQSHLLKWCCETEEHEEAFDTKDEFTAHLRTSHAGSFADFDLPLLTEIGARTIGPTFEICPFCGAKEMSDAHIEHHISDHLIELALFSLPPCEGMEETQPGNLRYTGKNGSIDEQVVSHSSSKDQPCPGSLRDLRLRDE